MPEPAASCTNCGATIAGRVCAFCGTLDGAEGGRAEEPLAIAELHRFISEATPEHAAKLLLHGFLPAAPETLIDAGTRTLVLLDEGSFSALGKAAARRLDAIAVKLKVSEGGPAAERAAAEFEARVAKFAAGVKEDDRSSNRIGLIGLFVVIGLLGWAGHCAMSCGGP